VSALNLPFKKEIADRIALWWVMALCCLQVLFVFFPKACEVASWHSALISFFGSAPTLDSLARVMFLAIALVAAAALMTARYLLGVGERLFVFCCLTVLAMAGMNGVVLASDLFTLYVFLELTAAASFILIAFERERDGFEGAFKYLMLSALATGMLLTGIGIFALTGEGLSYSQAGITLAVNRESALVWSGVALIVAGLCIKGGLVPFHGWVPDAYSSAPGGAAVLLAGIVTKAAGVYTLIRLVSSVIKVPDIPEQELGVDAAVLTFGTVSLLAGALLALVQSDLRRMLAYSSISQVGYIALGLGAGSFLGLAGAVFHLFNHAVFKSLLFVNAAAVEKETGLRDMNQMGGLSHQMPVTGLTSIIAMLSTAGIPPLSGFWSKLMIVVALWQAGYEWVAAAAVLGSLITLAYFLSLQRRVFYGELLERFAGVREAGVWVVVPAVALAVLTLLLGAIFPWLFNTFLVPVAGFL